MGKTEQVAAGANRVIEVVGGIIRQREMYLLGKTSADAELQPESSEREL